MVRFLSAALALWLAGAMGAAAQIQVSLQLPFAGNMPAKLSEWRENEALIRFVVQNTSTSSYSGLVLSAELTKDGRRIARTRDGHSAQPRFELGPGQTRSFSWRELVNEQALEYDRQLERQIVTTGLIPEGKYQLCVRVLDAMLRPLTPQPACGILGVILPPPPQLIRPIGGEQLPSSIVIFEWTHSAPPMPGFLTYRITVKPRYKGQTPEQAMQSNPVRFQHEVASTRYMTSVDEAHALSADASNLNYAGHVWQVQALLKGQPYGSNQGLSTIELFYVPSLDATPLSTNPAAVVWDIPYTELLSNGTATLTCDLPANTGDTLIMVLRVHAPRALTEDTLAMLEAPSSTSQTARYTGYVLNQAVASTAGRASGKTLGAVIRQAPPQGQSQDTSSTSQTARYTGGFFVYSAPQDTLPSVLREDPWKPRFRYTGVVYSAPQATLRLSGGVSRIQSQMANQWTKPLSGGGKVMMNTPWDSTRIPEYTLGLRQIAYNAGKEGAIIYESRAGSSTAYVQGRFIPEKILLPICPIVVEVRSQDTKPLDEADVIVAVFQDSKPLDEADVIGVVFNEKTGVVEYSWRVRRRPLCPPTIELTVHLDCPKPRK